MESTGTRLKRLRLEKGLSLEDVHKKTKLHLNILKAIEEDSLTGMNPVYLKGFLKIYCKLLGVEPKDYISEYKESLSPLKTTPSNLEKPLSFFKAASVKLDSFRFINTKIFIVISVVILLIGLFSLGKLISAKRGLKAKKNNPPTKSIQTTVAKDKHPETHIPKVVGLSTIRLSMRAKDDCWVNLKADGRTIFYGVLKKGKFESWQAEDKIEFSLGNAGGIEVELNNKPLPPLGRKGQAVKNILITKDAGLVVPR